MIDDVPKARDLRPGDLIIYMRAARMYDLLIDQDGRGVETITFYQDTDRTFFFEVITYDLLDFDIKCEGPVVVSYYPRPDGR